MKHWRAKAGLLAAAAGYAGLRVLAAGGRKNNIETGEMDGWYFAHRGWHNGPEAPENSLAAFARAADAGFGIELDVHLLADGSLAILHDSDLKRMCGREGVIEDLTAGDLPQMKLSGGEQHIPLLADVLALVGGRVPLIIELKTFRGNSAPLCEAVCRMLDDYPGVYCIESFDPKAVLWLRRNRPGIVRGQLSCNFFKTDADLSPFLKWVGTHMLFNLLTRPDFVAYRFEDRKNHSNQIARRLWRLAGASWTIRTPAQLTAALTEGYWPIFEGFDPRRCARPNRRSEKPGEQE